MLNWYYAVLSEPAGWYSAAVKAVDINAARAKLAKRFPFAKIVEVNR